MRPDWPRDDSKAKPFPKSSQLARGERRYRRKVASPKQWQAIIAAKQGPCRITAPMFTLNTFCVACNREPGMRPCDLCSRMEAATIIATGVKSRQLNAALQVVEYHHLIARSQGGDDVEDNIVPLTNEGHRRVTEREPVALAALAASLTDSERSYILGKLGEGGMERLFGVTRGER